MISRQIRYKKEEEEEEEEEEGEDDDDVERLRRILCVPRVDVDGAKRCEKRKVLLLLKE